MKRSRMSRSVKPKVHRSMHFKTKLRRALHHVAEEVGEPVHKLEAKFMKEFHKLSWRDQMAVENGIVLGGLTSTFLTIGLFFPAILPMSAIPAGISIGSELRRRAQRKFEKKKLREMALE